jgi:hypothetical protein
MLLRFPFVFPLVSQAAGSPFVGVFPTDRDHSVRVFDAGIPVRWTTTAPVFPAPSFAGSAHPGEAYYFQFGLWAYTAQGENEQDEPESDLCFARHSGACCLL